MNRVLITSALALFVIVVWIIYQTSLPVEEVRTQEVTEDPGIAPNHGDAAVSDPNLIAATRAALIGTWESADDAKFTQSFSEDGTMKDWYDGELMGEGTWKLYASSEAPPIDMPLTEGAVYLSITQPVGLESTTLIYRIDAATPERLDLTYTSRGNQLHFVKR